MKSALKSKNRIPTELNTLGYLSVFFFGFFTFQLNNVTIVWYSNLFSGKNYEYNTYIRVYWEIFYDNSNRIRITVHSLVFWIDRQFQFYLIIYLTLFLLQVDSFVWMFLCYGFSLCFSFFFFKIYWIVIVMRTLLFMDLIGHSI